MLVCGKPFLVLVFAASLTSTSAIASNGRVYLVDPVATPFVVDVEIAALMPTTPLHLISSDASLEILSYVSGVPARPSLVLMQSVSPSVGEDFLYDPPVDFASTSDAFAQVMLYYHAGQTLAYYNAVLGAAPVGRLVLVANALVDGATLDELYFSSRAIGAPWNADGVIFAGQGPTIDYAYDSDLILRATGEFIVRQEFTLGPGRFLTDARGYSAHGPAIEEGIAAYYAASMSGDAILGDYALGLAAPNLDLAALCTLEMNGGRMDGEILARVVWQIRSLVGSTVVDSLLWSAAGGLVSTDSLSDMASQLAAGLVANSSITEEARDAALALLESSELDVCDHNRVLIRDGQVTSRSIGLTELALDRPGETCASLRTQAYAAQAPFDLTFHALFGDLQLSIDIQETTAINDTGSWRAYLRAGAPVSFAEQSDIPTALDYDAVLDLGSNSTGKFTIGAATTPELVPGTDYFITLLHSSCAAAEFNVSLLATVSELIFSDSFE